MNKTKEQFKLVTALALIKYYKNSPHDCEDRVRRRVVSIESGSTITLYDGDNHMSDMKGAIKLISAVDKGGFTLASFESEQNGKRFTFHFIFPETLINIIMGYTLS